MSETITAAEFQALLKAEKKPRNKYRAVSVTLDGYRFDSKAEANRYSALKLELRAGMISDLRVHERYQIGPNIVYEADFSYRRQGRDIVEDVKGVSTPVFRLKEKLFRQAFPEIDFRVVKKQGAVR